MIRLHRGMCRPRLAWLGCMTGLAVAVLAGCGGKPVKSKPRPATQPAATTATLPGDRTIVEPTPSPTTASVPAAPPVVTQPASTYDSSPPYPVRLYVRHPRDEQPGWLKIIELSDQHAPATCTGEFPEHNRILINTDNVRKLRLHIGHLPLSAGKRTVLRIDKQGMELTTKNRRFIDFKRRDTGEWEVAGSE